MATARSGQASEPATAQEGLASKPAARASAGAPRRTSNDVKRNKRKPAPRSTSSKRAPRTLPWRKNVKPVIGIEIDGTTVTAVAVLPAGASAVATARERTWTDSLATVLKKMPAAAAYRAVVVSDGAQFKSLDISLAMRSRDQFEVAARAALGHPGTGVEVAGWVFDWDRLDSGLLSAGAVVAAPADPVHAAYRQLPSGVPSEIVAAALTAGPIEGLSLALRFTTAELTLVRDGRPVASQVLACGGLVTVEATLGQGNVTGPARLAAALAGTSSDPMAAHEVDRYLRAVVTDITNCVNAWERAGERVPREVYVYGPAARSAALPHLLNDANLTKASNGAIAGALINLDPAERPAAVGAYLAAATSAVGAPTVAFVDPKAVRSELAARARARKNARTKLTSTAAALIAAAALGPFAFITAHDSVLDYYQQATAAHAAAVTGLTQQQAASVSTYLWAQQHLTSASISPDKLKAVTDALAAVAPGAHVDVRALEVTVTGTAGDPVGVSAVATALSTATGWPAAVDSKATQDGYSYTIALHGEETK